jgi:hypothetical protein
MKKYIFILSVVVGLTSHALLPASSAPLSSKNAGMSTKKKVVLAVGACVAVPLIAKAVHTLWLLNVGSVVISSLTCTIPIHDHMTLAELKKAIVDATRDNLIAEQPSPEQHKLFIGKMPELTDPNLNIRMLMVRNSTRIFRHSLVCDRQIRSSLHERVHHVIHHLRNQS